MPNSVQYLLNYCYLNSTSGAVAAYRRENSLQRVKKTSPLRVSQILTVTNFFQKPVNQSHTAETMHPCTAYRWQELWWGNSFASTAAAPSEHKWDCANWANRQHLINSISSNQPKCFSVCSCSSTGLQAGYNGKLHTKKGRFALPALQGGQMLPGLRVPQLW